MHDSRIILGIDPGTLIMGYGIIEIVNGKLKLLEMGVLHLSKHALHGQRLALIYQKIDTLIQQYGVNAVAIEAPFFGKNVQSMLKLGRAQGVAIAAAMRHQLEAAEYAPRKVKQAITGKGAATKDQVWTMLQHQLKFDEAPEYMDATDAIAVAICHYYELLTHEKMNKNEQIPKSTRKTKKLAWGEFIAQQPNRVKS